jgi:uncharacterized protein (TIGR00251 family)
VLTIKVSPNAGRSEVVDVHGDCVRVRIAAAPERGKANKECVELLASFFRIKRSHVVVQRGETTRLKKILLMGMTREEVLKKLHD